ncbi:MAG: PQQ-binding-like beta-propeller repeat protein [Gemmataceae bacterium]
MTRLRLLFAPVLAGLATMASPLSAADWPQWMGPKRDAVWTDTGILDAFPKEGPKVLWRTPIEGGYAGPAVANGKVYVTDKLNKPGVKDPTNQFDTQTAVASLERVFCLDEKTGKEIWKHEDECNYKVSYGVGPRCTPTVDEGHVYTLGAMGNLLCLDAEKGKVIWSKDLVKEYATKVPMWGFSGHPLVYKNLLICLVGGKGSVAVAFDKKTGKEVWKALDAPEPGYCPPSLVEAGGVTQLIIWHAAAINGLNPETGEVYWSHSIKPNSGMSIMAPCVSGDLLFAGGNGGAQCVLRLRKDKPAADLVWSQNAVAMGRKPETSRGIAPINMTPFAEGGVIYGVDQPGMLRAFKPETGERLWWTFMPVIGKDEDEEFKGAGAGTAFIVKNGDRYFLFAETGHLIIAKLTPKGYEEISRAKILEQTGSTFGRKLVWSYPAFANQCVFARNDKEIVCYSLAK